MEQIARNYPIVKSKLSINQKINYRAWVLTVIKANQWSDSDIQNYFKLLVLKDPAGMAKTWLKGRRNQSYFQKYIWALGRLRMI